MSEYQKAMHLLKLWHPAIIEEVKKDLKNEHLKVDKNFCKRYFSEKHYTQVDSAVLAEAYAQDIAGGNVGLAEFIATRWILKNTDIYGFFEAKLKSINPDFELIKELSEEAAVELVQGAFVQFGPEKTYIFALFNSVAFPEKIYAALREKAEKAKAETQMVEETLKEKLQLHELQKRHEREMAALKDKYEKKLQGLQKKYVHDMELWKKRANV